MLGSPLEAWIQAGQAKNQNFRNSLQDIQGIGQGAAGIGTGIWEIRKQQLIQQLAAKMAQQGQPGATDQMPGIMSDMTRIDPEAGLKLGLQQAQMTPAFVGPNGQFSATQGEGFTPYGRVDKGTLMTGLISQQEHGAALEEKKKEAESSRQIRQLMAETARLSAENNHQAALERVEALRAAIEQRAATAQMQGTIAAQAKNAEHPVQNFWRSIRGKPPVVQTPGGASSGWSAADESRLQHLQGKRK